jgi:hypothetical protein
VEDVSSAPVTFEKTVAAIGTALEGDGIKINTDLAVVRVLDADVPGFRIDKIGALKLVAAICSSAGDESETERNASEEDRGR